MNPLPFKQYCWLAQNFCTHRGWTGTTKKDIDEVSNKGEHPEIGYSTRNTYKLNTDEMLGKIRRTEETLRFRNTHGTLRMTY